MIKLKSVFFAVGFLLLMPYSFAGQSQGFASLQNANRQVVVLGEVLDVFKRPGGVWVNLLTEKGVVSVWADNAVKLPAVKYKAGYNVVGDTIKVKGVLQEDFKNSTGPLLIAESIEAVKPGSRIIVRASAKEKQTAIVLFVTCIAVRVMFALQKGLRKNAG